MELPEVRVGALPVLTAEQISAFPSVCLLSVDENNNTVGEWGPIEIAEIKGIQRFLEIVKSDTLTQMQP